MLSLWLLSTGAGGYTAGEVRFEAASAQGNVGLSAGIVGTDMPDAVKLAFVPTVALEPAYVLALPSSVVYLWQTGRASEETDADGST